MLSTLEKAGRILRLFSAENPEWGVSEVARQLRLPKTSAHDALCTLVHVGLVHRTVTGRYRLGFLVVSLHAVLMAQTAWRHVAHEELAALAARVPEPLALMAFDGGHAICIAEYGPGVRSAHLHVGALSPLHASSAGKVLLASRSAAELRAASAALEALTPNTITSHDELLSDLRRVRQRGYAVDLEELEMGRCTVSAPVHNVNGEIIAAVTLSADTAAFLRHRAAWQADVLATAGAVSARLGYVPSVEPRRLQLQLVRGRERLRRTSAPRPDPDATS